jgi:hypothetical protein
LPDISKINALAIGSVSKVDGLAKASILDIDGVAVATVPAPAAAYSVRLLGSGVGVSSYTGPAMRVRRDTGGGTGDDDEADIAFDSGVISLDSAISNASAGVTATTLGQFLNVGTVGGTTYSNPDSLSGTASCYVDEWKDQSGNANHATQGTFGSQPQIHDGTVNTDLITKNGKPALDYDKSNQSHFSFATSALNGKYPDLFMVLTVDTYSSFGTSTLSQTTSGNYYTQLGLGNVFFVQGSSTSTIGINVADSQQRLIEQYANGTSVFTVYDTTSYSDLRSTSAYPSGTLTFRIGKHTDTRWDLDGQMQEYIIWADNQSSTNRTRIEDNLNDFFSIY